jgi:hypothetical protein
MRKYRLQWLRWSFLLLGFADSAPLVQAQYFNLPGNGDLVAGFRKTGAHQGTNELVVYLDNITNLLAVQMGSTITLSNLSATRLTDAFSSDYTYLQWSVFGANFNLSSPWSTSLGNFPQSTLWYTLPRTNSSIQTTARSRFSKGAQTSIGTSMISIGRGAGSIANALPGGTNANNNAILVREPFQQAYAQFYLTAFMGDAFNSTIGDLGGSLNFNIEQITPSPFSSSVRSDLYESAPAASSRPAATYVDPISGSTTSVYYVGYFDLSPSGVLTFTRGASSSGSNPPPPPGQVSVGVTGAGAGSVSSPGTNLISFLSTNGATYTLFFTNSSGLTTPVGNWPSLTGTVTGDGTVKSFTDIITTNVDNRFYRIGVH